MEAGFVVYDVSEDLSPTSVLRGSIELTGSSGHMGNFAPDGLKWDLLASMV